MNSFIENLLLILLPAIMGIISSKFILNSWQTRKEKFLLRKEILLEFQNTFPKAQDEIYAFYYTLVDHYSKIENVSVTDSNMYKINWKYSDTIPEPPKTTFQEKYGELKNKILQANYHISHFESTLELYYKESRQLTKTYYEIREILNNTFTIIDKLYNSKKIDELDKSNSDYLKFYEKGNNKIIEFRTLLINSRINNPKA